MKTMDIIFNYDDYSDEFVNDLTIWCEEHSVPTSKIIIGMKEDNVDGIDYYVITLNETLFSYLMMREFNIFEQYGSEGWNRYIQSEYHCEIV
tara:strand:+ start:498 stop:773 length:276 start_codon:yes stop_codon:yes gene_type:complete